jgi:protein-L-isoaspartate(D-aspartate) O-methyltransferase
MINQNHEQLVKELIDSDVLKSTRIIKAFSSIDRINFVPEELKRNAYINAPLSIDYRQTISQPLTVAFMLELLQPKPGNKILDVGSGSGWQTALLAHIVSPKGKVFGIEIIPELHKQSIANISKYDYIKKGVVKMYCQNAFEGLPDKAPFDHIIAAAEVLVIPQAWKDQLKTGGHIVAPKNNSLFLFTKKANNEFEEEEHPDFAFVPFVT